MASRPEMREDDESGFCKFFRNLTHKEDDTVRIFDRGDYYSAHGDDAKLIADSVSVTMSVVSMHTDQCRFTGRQLYSASWGETLASTRSP
jgi:DNA mismatch repair ATPase MutS